MVPFLKNVYFIIELEMELYNPTLWRHTKFDLISTFIIITVLFICLLNIPYFYLLDDLKLSKSKVKYTIFV